MKVERVATRVVKPWKEGCASSIPNDIVALSSSDMVVPPVHVEVVYAFNAPAPPVCVLEQGLAKAIRVYREWAGRLGKDERGRPAIELNDEGVAFIEAQADGSIQEMMPFHPVPRLRDLVPINQGVPELLLIQVTKFSCGGITIGVARHHQVADGTAASTFMNAWASIVKGLPLTIEPLHDRSALMGCDPPQPAYDHIEYEKPLPKPDSDSEASDYPLLAVKRFHFSVDMLQKIKHKAAKENGELYTTFESLASHLWRSITEARGVSEDVQTRVKVPINVRKRLDNFPDSYFGNVISHACAQTTAQELLEQPLSFAAGLMHAAIKRVDRDYIRSALDFIELQQQNNPVQITKRNRTGSITPNVGVSTWVHLPLYQLDFGWGTPVFAGNAGLPYEGSIILIPSHTKDGSVNATVGLFAPDMAKFEEIYNQL
ncbi:hypothetical protein O6H91_22G023400 [Diphasiastrum complanatum]|uniref:Uncharacterized protein n=2 Tax=Diphasiastrum complanatum TaxID=34168 RepID=A0ACC2ADP3_DIPCM|nr:hypothetical protein O6H91_22G023400 [Diphasiastrum complanatum]KAJ7515685.1 hypothetical protein O6H91_22G023400 [Diphasiastrum complanatum]